LSSPFCCCLFFIYSFFALFIGKVQEGYDPNKSKVSDDKMTAFNESDLTGDLLQIPGIGPAAVAKLLADDPPVQNSFHLIGKYMAMCQLEQDEDGEGPRVDTYSLNQRFWVYLKNLGIVAHRSAIVKAMSSKVGTLLPAFMDANTYGDEADDDE
jgi:hypothetical protein